MNKTFLRDLLYANINKKKLVNNSIYLKKFNRFNRNKVFSGLFIYVHALKRSTRVSVFNSKNLLLFTISSGFEFKKSNRRGVFSATRIINTFLNKLDQFGTNNLVFCLKGYGPGRRAFLKSFNKMRFKSKKSYLLDLTSIAFNGCRLKKQRRL